MRVFCAFFAIILFFANAASAFDSESGPYFFRYKANAGYTATDPGPDDGYAKDITVFYVGGVGHPFSERLPLKPQWEDDSWQIVGGNLPSGISFNPVNRTFSGTPDTAVDGVEIEMVGIDKNGKQIADATVTFDIVVLPENVQNVDLYAHTNKYIAHSLPLPDGISVYRWERVYPAPKGVDINERFFDGTPTQEGITPVLIQGYNYLGEAIIAYLGKYTVENGPSFPFIEDDFGNIDIKKRFREINKVNTRIKRAIDDPSLVRYFVEIDQANPLPGTLRVGGNASSRTIAGRIVNPYEDGSLRYRAVDVDGTEGYSNWFKIGTLGPDPECKPTPATAENGQIKIPGVVDKMMAYGVPFEGLIGTRNYVLVDSPTLPAWLSFDAKTGLFSGIPNEKTTIENINVRIEITNSGIVDTETCGPYTIEVNSADLAITAKVEEGDIRVGSDISVAVATQGKLIAPYSITLDPSSVLPAGLTFDDTALTLTGKVNQTGNYSATFLLSNGDGRTLKATASFRVYAPLEIYDLPPVIEIPRYNVEETLASITFNQDTVIGMPVTSLVGTLPSGFFYSAPVLKLHGGTRLAEGDYGPFQIRLTDDTGEEDLTSPFIIRVTPREDMLAGGTASATVTAGTEVSHTPFSVIQPPLADELPLTYTLTGPALPSGLVFGDGMITGSATVVGQYDGYKVTVVDSEQKSASSEVFSVTVEGEDATPITPLILPQTVGNVTGAIPTFLTTGPIDLSSKAGELVGGVAAARFKSVEPLVPGLAFDPSTGMVSGAPTEEFDGTLTITYEDGAGRQGVVKAPLLVLPYPTLTPLVEYQVPRHEDLSKKNLKVDTNTGWRGTIQWSVDPSSGPLPSGVQFVEGKFIGTTAAPLGSFPSIVVRAHDSLTGISVVSAPFTLNVVPGSDMELNPSPATISFYLDKAQVEVRRDVFAPASLIPTGTYVEPLTYSSVGDLPIGLGLDQATGQFTTAPSTFGEWTVTLRVTDIEGRSADAEVTVIAVLDGSIEALIDGLPATGMPLKTVRVGETIATPVVSFQNVQGDYTLSLNRPVPVSMNFNYRTARFYGMFSQEGEFEYKVTALDNGGRELGSALTYPFNVVSPLSIPSPEPLYEVKQYTPSGVSFNLPKAENILGEVRYMFSGTVPGSLVIRDYSNQGQAYYLLVAANGDVSPILESNLPLDAIIFDTKEASLTGVASKLGRFGGLTYVAEDDHMEDYLVMSDPTRVANNTAQSAPFEIQVNLPDPIELNVSDYKTKPGFAFSMQTPWTEGTVSSSNTYGAVNYFLTSADAAAYPELSIDTQTGALSGTFDSLGIRRLNVNVSDITNRLTSKTVTIEVMPNLRLIAPQTVYLDTNSNNSEAIGVDYAIGDIAFEKGSGDWPAGVTVDASTGNIVGRPPAGTEEYPGLTIVGTDAAGDRQVSNVFRIVSRPIGPSALLMAGALPDGTKRTAYSFSFVDTYLELQEVTPAQLSWRMTADKQGERLPDGLNLSGGVLSGTPLLAGSYTFTVEATSQYHPGLKASRQYSLNVALPQIELSFTDTSLPSYDRGDAIDVDLDEMIDAINIPKSEITWAISASNAGEELPPGVNVVGSRLSGYANTAGQFTFTLTATFSNSQESLSKDTVITLNVEDVALDTQFVSLSNGMNGRCGITDNANLFCWGAITGTTYPVKVDIPASVDQVAVGSGHACAVTTDGDVYCWGSGVSYKLGNGTTTSSTTPILVSSLPVPVTKVAVSDTSTCAITASGDMWCWGTSVTGSSGTKINPTLISTLGAADISMGPNHGCVLLTTGTARCWGDNNYAQLGNNSTSSVSGLATVQLLSNAVSIVAGDKFTCAVTGDGKVMCWGRNNVGQIGDGGTISTVNTARRASQVTLVANVVKIGVGGSHACAIQNDGKTFCWGQNVQGSLGTGVTTSFSVSTPREATVVSNLTNITSGQSHSCFVEAGGATKCWGHNASGQLGNSTTTPSATPVGVTGFSN